MLLNIEINSPYAFLTELTMRNTVCQIRDFVIRKNGIKEKGIRKYMRLGKTAFEKYDLEKCPETEYHKWGSCCDIYIISKIELGRASGIKF